MMFRRYNPAGDPAEANLATPQSREVMVHATKPSAAYFPADLAYADVQRALDTVPDSLAADGRGAWVGPPRVVRHANSMQFHVARVFRFNDNIPFVLPTHLDSLRAQVVNRLEPLTEVRSWTVNATAFNPALNGQLAWWENGSASRSRTRDSYPELAARFTDPEENPTGPTDASTHPTTPIGGGGVGGFSWGLILGGAAALGGVVYVVSRTRQREVVIRSEPRSNPARRRR